MTEQEESIPGYKITVETVEQYDGTYVYENENKTKIKLDPSDRLDLVYRFDKILSHLKMYHTGVKAACMGCSAEFIVSGSNRNNHKIDDVICPECGNEDIINLDASDDI